jgi:hypothetical protein
MLGKALSPRPAAQPSTSPACLRSTHGAVARACKASTVSLCRRPLLPVTTRDVRELARHGVDVSTPRGYLGQKHPDPTGCVITEVESFPRATGDRPHIRLSVWMSHAPESLSRMAYLLEIDSQFVPSPRGLCKQWDCLHSRRGHRMPGSSAAERN